MKPKICDCIDCGNIIESADGYAIGLCDRHLELLRALNSFAGICHNCGCLTYIKDKPRGELGRVLPKYLFSKDCDKCTKGSDGANWLTTPKGNAVCASYDFRDGQPVRSEVTPEGSLIIRNNIIFSGRKCNQITT
jgi:hypothetical protein